MAHSFDGIDSGMFADALDILNHDGAMVGLQPVSHGQRFHGRALTVRMLVGTPGTFAPEEIALGKILQAASKDDVIIIDVGGEYITVWGELAAIAAQNIGVAGLIVERAPRVKLISVRTLKKMERAVGRVSRKVFIGYRITILLANLRWRI